MPFNSSWNLKKQVSAKYSNSHGKAILRNSIVEEAGKCQWGFFGWHSGILHTFCIQLAAQNTQLCDAEAGCSLRLNWGKRVCKKVARFSKFLTFPEDGKRSPIRISNQDSSCFLFLSINEKISLKKLCTSCVKIVYKLCTNCDKYKLL